MRLLLVLPILYFIGCNTARKELIKIEGAAQGTTYHISYIANAGTDLKPQMDSILRRIDTSLSTYLSTSLISKINNGDTNVLVDEYFTAVFNKAMEIGERTAGLFDVTVGPVVNAYGFGPARKTSIDTSTIDSLLQFVGYKKVSLQNGKVMKTLPGIQLDFNAIAQGYTVDVLSKFIANLGIQNYLVELGGELKASGDKFGEPWKVGIDKPVEGAGENRELEAIVSLHNMALCTSGNYRKFYEEDGRRYAHIINPLTGQPARQNILSATVLAADGMTADAYATAFMVMGLEKAKQFLAENKDLHLLVYFVYDDGGKWHTYSSPGLKANVEELK